MILHTMSRSIELHVLLVSATFSDERFFVFSAFYSNVHQPVPVPVLNKLVDY